MCEQWAMVVHDFAAVYGIRLRTAGLTWREFCTYLTGLLATPTSLLAQHFHAQDEPTTEGGLDGGSW